MPTAEEVARGLRTKRNSSKKQRALEGFGIPDRAITAIGWDEALPESIARLVVAMTRLGGAVMFGGSRDGGALQVMLYLDGDRKSLWITDPEAVDEELAALSQVAEARP